MIEYIDEGMVVVPFEYLEKILTAQGMTDGSISFTEQYKIKELQVNEVEGLLIANCELFRELVN